MRPSLVALAVWSLLAPSAPVAALAPQDARSAPADLLTDLRDDGSLVAALGDESTEVRWAAARGLARLAEAPQVPIIAARLPHEPNDDVLAELVFALGQKGHLDATSAAPPLLALLNSDRGSLRAAAATALGRLGVDSPTAALVERLDSDPSEWVRACAAIALFRLDGRRYEHVRTVPPELLDRRDALLARASIEGVTTELRWRATYAMAGVRGRAELARRLPATLAAAQDPLSRLFALRGLRALEGEELLDAAPLGLRFVTAPDESLRIEAAHTQARHGVPELLIDRLIAETSALARLALAESLRERLGRLDVDDAMRASWCEQLEPQARADASPMVRRELAALIAALGPPDHALFDLHWLASSDDPRDRERAAKELATRAPLLDAALLERLLHDVPAVAAAALPADCEPSIRLARLTEALAASDAALVAVAAEESMKPAAGGAAGGAQAPAPPTDPVLVAALQSALGRAVGPEMKEARSMLRKALGLPPDTAPPACPTASDDGTLLERLLAEHRDALADPSPRVRLLTSKGDILLQLDRVNAPRHVASFLELAQAGFYDGLDFHRVVPNFVVQGLDPRGDGYGTGGRRMPDEFSPRAYEAGTLGMPNAGEPHTGGCQIFLTHVPTPHLDGNYTAFGQVIEGMDVVQQLEIGDTVTHVRPDRPGLGIPSHCWSLGQDEGDDER